MCRGAAPVANNPTPHQTQQQNIRDTRMAIHARLQETGLTNADNRRLSMTSKALNVVTDRANSAQKQLNDTTYSVNNAAEMKQTINTLNDNMRGRAVSFEGEAPVQNEHKIDRQITNTETEALNALIEEVRGARNCTRDQALAELVKVATTKALESRSNQTYQLENFLQSLELVELLNQSDEGQALLNDWHDNKYKHYIRDENGRQARSPIHAVEIVRAQVQAALDANGELSPKLMRNIAELDTILSKTLKPDANAFIALDNMIKVLSEIEPTEETNQLQERLINGLYNHLYPEGTNNRPNRPNNLAELNPLVQAYRNEHGILPTDEARALLTTEWNNLKAMDGVDDISIRYPDSGPTEWDNDRPLGRFKKIQERLALFPKAERLHASHNATYHRLNVDALDDSNLRAEKSGFGPSYTVWYGERSKDVMSNASPEQQKAYAVCQANAWSMDAEGKYNWTGSHALTEALLTYLDAALNGNSDNGGRQPVYLESLQRTIVRSILENRITVEDGQLVANPRTHEHGLNQLAWED